MESPGIEPDFPQKEARANRLIYGTVILNNIRWHEM
jgi:hypothetical protein